MRRLVPLLTTAALLALPAVSAQALSFGPDLSTATPSNPYGCNAGIYGYATAGCTVADPLYDDMETLLPNPVTYGDQTGVVTDIHVLSAGSAPAQFVVVDWAGKPGEGNPFPSAVTALSAQVELHAGMNNFNTNLPVSLQFHSNGYETYSVVAINILDGTDPIPAETSGSFSETGMLFDNGLPLTQTTSDLTVPPNNVSVSGFYPSVLLMSGDVTNTTQTAAPAATVTPAITGTDQLGQVLSCSHGTWSPTATAFAYQWKRDGAAITGATGSTYTIGTADQGHVLTCTVSATGTTGTGSATSAAVSVPAAQGGGGTTGGGGGGTTYTPVVSVAGLPTTAAQGSTVLVTPGITEICPAGGSTCSANGTANAVVPAAATAKTKRVVIGQAKITIPAGKLAHYTFKLNAQGAKLLKKLHQLHVTVVLVSRDGSGTAVTTTKTITIKTPAKRKH